MNSQQIEASALLPSDLQLLVNKVSRLQQTLADRDNTICDLQTALRLNKQVIEDLSVKLCRQSASLREHKRKDSWWNSKSSSKLNHTSKAVKNDLLNLSACSLQTDLCNSLNSLIKENIILQDLLFQKNTKCNEDLVKPAEADCCCNCILRKTCTDSKEIQTDNLQTTFSAEGSCFSDFIKILNEAKFKFSSLSEIVHEFINFNDLLADEYELEYDISSTLIDIKERSLKLISTSIPSFQDKVAHQFQLQFLDKEEHQGSSADSKSIIHLGVNNTEKSEERVDTYLSIVDANCFTLMSHCESLDNCDDDSSSDEELKDIPTLKRKQLSYRVSPFREEINRDDEYSRSKLELSSSPKGSISNGNGSPTFGYDLPHFGQI